MPTSNAKMAKLPKTSTIGVWLATGAVFQDYVPFSAVPILSMAKIMFVLSLPFLASTGFSKKFSKLSFSVLIYSVLLVAGSVLLGAGGISDRTVSISISLIIGFISFLLISQAKVSPKTIIRSFEFWVIISSALGIFQAITGTGFVSDRSFEAYIIPGIFRASGFTDDPNYFALLCLMGYALSTSHDVRHPKMLQFMALAAIVLSGSRAGIITAVLLFLIKRVGGFLSFSKIVLLLIFIASALILAFTFQDKLPAGFSEMTNRASYSMAEGANSLSFRMTALISAIHVFLENPVFGYGLGNNVYHPHNFLKLVSHNTFVETAAESGIFGLILFLNLMYRSVRAATGPRATREPEIMVIISMLFAAVILMALTLVIEYSRIFFFFLVLVEILTRSDLSRKPGRARRRLPGTFESSRTWMEHK
jgi:O-antigen ligase